MSLQSAFLGVNDSLFANINTFESVSNILDSVLDLFCDWLCPEESIQMRFA